jgi:hypothetical protein
VSEGFAEASVRDFVSVAADVHALEAILTAALG